MRWYKNGEINRLKQPVGVLAISKINGRIL
ncbi:hypothetical protein LSPH24S_06872 [Lysinibacillus sphaericus]